MKNLIKKKLKNFLGQSHLEEKNNKILKNLGIINSKLNKERYYRALQDYEFQIFSQFGDDGIINQIINALPSPLYKYHSIGFIDNK